MLTKLFKDKYEWLPEDITLPKSVGDCTHPEEYVEVAANFMFRHNVRAWRCMKCRSVWVERAGKFTTPRNLDADESEWERFTTELDLELRAL